MPHRSIKNLIDQAPKMSTLTLLSKELPNKLSKFILDQTNVRDLKVNELSKKVNKLDDYIHRHHVKYKKNEGYRKAEVMKGGICASELKRSLEAEKLMDYTLLVKQLMSRSLLGGYNFQWAWASGRTCAYDIIKRKFGS